MGEPYLSVAMYILLTTSNRNAFSIPEFCKREEDKTIYGTARSGGGETVCKFGEVCVCVCV